MDTPTKFDRERLIESTRDHLEKTMKDLGKVSARRLRRHRMFRETLSERPSHIDGAGRLDRHEFSVPEQANPLYYDDEKGKELVYRACRGDFDAAAVLYKFGAHYVRYGEPMPPILRSFNFAGLYSFSDFEPETKRGRPRDKNFVRNAGIWSAVYQLGEFGLKPTRNEATRERDSACSIVVEALRLNGINLSERSVDKIWAQNWYRDVVPERRKY